MSHNRKLTHWFAPSSLGKPSSKGASADSKPPINSSQSVSRREDHRAGPYPPTARHRSLNGNIPKSIPTGHPIPRVSRITDLADSGVETDSSVELVSTRAMSSRQISSSQPTPFRTVFNGKKYVDPVRKGVDSNSGVESSKDGKSPIVIELSSDAMTPSTVSPKSSVSVSDDNSDAVSRLKRRTASPSSAMSKRQRVSESLPAVGSGPGKSSPGERARRHVEVTLTMRPPPRKDDRDNDAMVWVPTPSQSASRNAISNSKSKSLTTDRSQDTPKTFTEPQTDTAAEIIARMKADASAKPSAISSDTESEDNRAAIAAALADDTSDNDDGDDAAELLFGQKRLPSIKQASTIQATRKQRNLFSTSDLSSASEDDPDGAQISDAEDSPSEYPALRRSSRIVAPPKPIAALTPAASRPRRKQTEFDRLLLEDTRRNRARGGFGGYKQAEYLAVLESSSANEADSSDDDQDVGSSTKSTGWPGDSVGARSHSSRASSFLSDADDNAPISETNIHAGDESHASGIAQKYLGHEDTKRLKDILRDDVAGSTNLRILVEDGAPSLGDKRTLWEKTNLSTHTTSAEQFSTDDALLKRLFSAIQIEKSLEAMVCLQRWETYQKSTDPKIVRQFVDISLHSAIYSLDVLLGDNVTSSLVRLIEKHSDNLGIVGLTVRDLIVAACVSLGAKHDILRAFNFVKADPLGINELERKYNIVARGKAHRALCSARYIRLMTALASSGVLEPDELSDVIVFSVLIACDPSSPQELERRVTKDVQEIYNKSVDAATERRVCDALVHSFKNSTWSQKHLVASLLPNHTASSRRLQAWAAFGFLVPNEFCKVTAQRYLHPPTLVPILAQLLDRGLTATKLDVLFDLRESAEPLRVPDFDHIAIQTHILDIMLTDVRSFVEYERETEKVRAGGTDSITQPVSMPIVTGKKRTVLDVLINSLQLMHDGIADSRAAHLDRSRLKQILQRLHVRLTYEKHSALEFVAHKEGAPMRMSLDAHFSRMPMSGSPRGPSL